MVIRYGTIVFKIQNTELINFRLPTPFLPVSPLRLGRFFVNLNQNLLFASCLCNIIIYPLYITCNILHVYNNSGFTHLFIPADKFSYFSPDIMS